MPGGRELVSLRPIGQHHPDLASAVARRFENDVPPVGRPRGVLVLPVAGQHLDLPVAQRKDRDLELKTAEHTYERPGRYTVAVKVIDIFGNDTMTLVPVNVG